MDEAHPSLFGDDDDPLRQLNYELRILIKRHGFDEVEATLGRIKIDLSGPVHAAPAREHDPRTSHDAAKSTYDVRRFSVRSYSAKLLTYFAHIGASTDRRATEAIMGRDADIGAFEGCRRRCSDLRAAGYLRDTKAERDGRIVWAVTPEGYQALERLGATGWSR